jgi:hypothetical protein
MGSWAAKKAETETALKMITTYKDLGDLAEEVGVLVGGWGVAVRVVVAVVVAVVAAVVAAALAVGPCWSRIRVATLVVQHELLATRSSEMQTEGARSWQRAAGAHPNHLNPIVFIAPPDPTHPTPPPTDSPTSRTTTPAPLRTWTSPSPTSRSLASRCVTCLVFQRDAETCALLLQLILTTR